MKKSKLLLGLITALVLIGVYFGVLQEPDPGVWGRSPLEAARVEAKPQNEKYDLASIEVMTKVITYIKNYYYDPARIHPKKMFTHALDEVARNVASVLVNHDEESKKSVIRVDTWEREFTYDDIDSPWDIQYRMSEVFRFLQPHFDDYVDPKDVEYAAINGMLDTLDPHSTQMSPKIYNDLKVSTQGNFGGLGIQIGIRDGELTVIAPIKGTPAARKGLKSLDKIVRIEGQSTVNMPLEEAVKLMRGKPQTPCKLHIMRKGFNAPKEFVIIRDVIKIESTESKLLGDGIGYVRIKNFQGNTVRDMKEFLFEAEKKKPLKGLIIDLRHNPGGLLEAAIDMGDLFLSEGVIVTTVGSRNEIKESKEARATGTEPNYPILVLVNHGSASASEIVSGALKNNNRAVILGDRTFGKGSVQLLYEMEDESALKLTIAQYLTPGDVSIQSVGIVPDIKVLPVFIDENEIEFFTSDGLSRESELDGHLVHDSTVEDKEVYTLRYLHDEKRDELDADASLTQILIDFPVLLAKELLQGIEGVSRREMMLQRLMPELRKISSREDKKIVHELKKYDVDWSVAEVEQPPEAEIKVWTEPKAPIKAGDKVTLWMSVKNVGQGAYHRLVADSKSDWYLFDRMELFFGKIAPGQTVTRKIPIEVPPDTPSREAVMDFHFTESNQYLPPKTPFRFEVTTLPLPDFSYTYQIRDESGNGDGLIQRGETVEILVDVLNQGEGSNIDGLAIIKNTDNLKDVFIKKGRMEFDPIKPGERKLLSFEIEVLPGLEDSKFPMEISIIDTDMRVATTQEITFNLMAPFPLTPAPSGQVISLAKDQKILSSPDARLPVLTVVGEPKNATVAATSGRWAKINIDKDRFGWVEKDAGWHPQPGKATLQASIDRFFHKPVVEVNPISYSLFTEEPEITLRGYVKDDNRVRDMFIMNNSRKVFYKSNKTGVDFLKMPFETSIPLEEGQNIIRIVARESDKFVGYKTLVINRKRGPENEMAANKAAGE